jgi:hypothetical protein
MSDIDKIAELEKSLWDATANLPLGSKELEAANRKASRVGLAADRAIDAERCGLVVDFRAVMSDREGHPRLGAREWWGDRPLDATITPLELVEMVANDKLDCWSAREWLAASMRNANPLMRGESGKAGERVVCEGAVK